MSVFAPSPYLTSTGDLPPERPDLVQALTPRPGILDLAGSFSVQERAPQLNLDERAAAAAGTRVTAGGGTAVSIKGTFFQEIPQEAFPDAGVATTTVDPTSGYTVIAPAPATDPNAFQPGYAYDPLTGTFILETPPIAVEIAQPTVLSPGAGTPIAPVAQPVGSLPAEAAARSSRLSWGARS